MSAKPTTCVELRIPPLRDPETRRAYAAALIKDVSLTANELEDKPSVLRLIGPEFLDPESFLDLSIALHRDLLGDSTRVFAEVTPRYMSAALVGSLRNLRVRWYTLDFHTLNISDLKASGSRLDLSYYENLMRLVRTFELTNVTAVLDVGIPSQNTSSLRDSLQRAAELGVGAICLKPKAEPAEGVNAEDLLSEGKRIAESLGYEGVSADKDVLLALPAFRNAFLEAITPADEQFGVGCGAVTSLEGVSLRNTADVRLYIAHVGEPDLIMRNI